MDASWQPDPTRRHEYRWWDGQQWTEHVSDGGQTSVDPISAPPAPVVPPAPAPLHFAAPLPPAGGPVTTPKTRGKGLIVGVAIAAALLVAGAVAVVLLAGGDDGGSTYGVTEDTLVDDESFVTRSFQLDEGEAIRIRVEPEGDLDTNPGVVVNESTAEAIADVLGEEFEDEFTDASSTGEMMDELFTDSDVFSDSDAADEFEDMFVYQTFDYGVEGEPDSDWVLAPVSGTYQLVVTAYDGDGEFRVIVEKYDDVVAIDDDLFSDDGPLSEDFFTDDDFYSDSRSYEPDED
jgi:hypothetical protein